MTGKWFLLIVLIFTILTACNSDGNASNSNDENNENNGNGENEAGNEQEEVEVRFASWEDRELFEPLIEEFEEQNSHININFINTPGDNYEDQLFTMIAGNDAPDVMQLFEVTLPEFVRNDTIQDLTPFYSDDGDFDIDDFFEASLELAQHNEGLYGLGYSLAPQFMFYNIDAFDEAGIDYPNDDWTWDDFLQAAVELTIEEDGRTVQFGTNTNDPGFEVPTLINIWQNGGEYIKDGQPNFDDPQVIEAIQYWADMVLEHGVSPSPAQESGEGELFTSGRVAMHRDGIWMADRYREVDDFAWDIAPLPQNQEKATALHSSYFAISSDSEVEEAAWEFIKFMTSTETQVKANEHFNYLPTRISADEEQPYVREDNIPASAEIISEAGEYGRMLESIPGITEINSGFRSQLELIYMGEKTAEEAMLEFQETAMGIYEANN